MFRKTKGLAMKGEDFSKMYVIQTKIVSLFLVASWRNSGGIKMVPQQNLWVDCGSGRAPRVW
jgi:hypothetical protein